jgi:uncharacterized protein (TIGR02246 family)
MGATRPEQLHELFGEAINNNDMAALLSLYDSECLALDLNGNTVQGEAPMKAMLEGLGHTIVHIEGTTRKALVNGDLALLSIAWTATIDTPAGAQTATGTTAEVARRQPDGTWKFFIDDPQFV